MRPMTLNFLPPGDDISDLDAKSASTISPSKADKNSVRTKSVAMPKLAPTRLSAEMKVPTGQKVKWDKSHSPDKAKKVSVTKNLTEFERKE